MATHDDPRNQYEKNVQDMWKAEDIARSNKEATEEFLKAINPKDHTQFHRRRRKTGNQERRNCSQLCPQSEACSGDFRDAYSPAVIRQSFRYAGNFGAPYFCIFNGDHLVVFDAYEEGVPLLERSTKSYEISRLGAFGGTFLDEIARIRAGDARWDASDSAFIERVRSLHEQIAPALDESLADHLDEDEVFREDFAEWMASQSIEYENASASERTAVREEFAEQASYLLINKIIFYKLLEDSPRSKANHMYLVS